MLGRHGLNYRLHYKHTLGRHGLHILEFHRHALACQLDATTGPGGFLVVRPVENAVFKYED